MAWALELQIHGKMLHSNNMADCKTFYTQKSTKNECEPYHFLLVSGPQPQDEPAPELAVSHLNCTK